jgi:hypothetical protein
MRSAICRVLEDTMSPAVVSELTASCGGPGRVNFALIATRPGNVTFLVSKSDANLPNYQANSTLLFDQAATTVGVAYGQLSYPSPGTRLSFGACGLDTNAAYAVHVAVQDLADPALYSNVTFLPFIPQSLCAQPEEAVCDVAALLHPLQPRLRVTSGPGLLSGLPSLLPTTSGLSITQARHPGVLLMVVCLFIILGAISLYGCVLEGCQ